MKQLYQKTKLLCSSLLLLLPVLASAQWMTQTVTLNPGWNAIFMEVEPEPNECRIIFNNVDIDSIRANTAQYELDEPAAEEYWIYYPPKTPKTTSLFTLQGGKTYSIHYPGDTPVDIAISGKPVLNELTWKAGIQREAGFQVDATNSPTFNDFLAAEPAFGSNAIEKMNASGNWVPIAGTETINKGEAYRLTAAEYSNFVAPFTVETELNNGLDFDQFLLDLDIRIENHTGTTKQIAIAQLLSEDNVFAPYNLAGAVALNYWDTSNQEWVDLSGGLTLAVPANDKTLLRVSIDRNIDDMPFSIDGLYQGLLEFKDNQGTVLTVPVSGFGLWKRTGLWVGSASIDMVNDVNNASPKAVPTDSEFNIRLIVHVDEDGNAKLLDQVIQMWKEGMPMPSFDNPDYDIVDVPGQYVLITDDAILGDYVGSAVRDGKTIGRRISSAFFSFDAPQTLGGTFDGTLTTDLVLDYDDPVNPFKHKYHPDHNNLDEQGDPVVRIMRDENGEPLTNEMGDTLTTGEGIESYTVERSIQLAFSTNDPDNLSFSGFGDNQAGGTYIETVKGIHRQDLNVRGTFRLSRVSQIGVLDGPSTPEQISQRRPQRRGNYKALANTAVQRTVTTLDETAETIPVVKIYPNPVVEELQFTGLDAGDYNLAVRDFSGKTVLSQPCHADGAINVRALVPGVYTLEVRSKTWVQNLKFVKQSPK